jgi:Restriction endonuclease/Sel1 repeat
LDVRLAQRLGMTFIVFLQFFFVSVSPLKAAEPSSNIRLEDFARVETMPVAIAAGINESSIQGSNITELIADSINAVIQRWPVEKILQGSRTLVIRPEIVELQLGKQALFRNSHFRFRLIMTEIDGQLIEERQFSAKANGAASVFTKGHSDSRMYTQASTAMSAYLDDLASSARERIQQAFRERIKQRITAADAGDVAEQVALGKLYSAGEELQRDATQAVMWWQRAADQGNTEAQVLLGLALATGQGVQQDDELAVLWLRKAATQGNAEAQWRLASLLDSGRGRALNSDEAEKLWLEAARQGISVAQEHVAKLRDDMKPNATALAEPPATYTSVEPQPIYGESSTSMNPLLIIAVVLILMFFTRAYVHRKTCAEALAKVDAIALSHSKALARRRNQLVTHDAYGKPLLDKWNKELSYFIDTYITPELTSKEKKLYHTYSDELVSVVMRHVHVATLQNQNSLAGLDIKDMSPTDYEALCANELRKGGWHATTTKGSGDQGVDVIAERNGVRLILQCKLYTNPVGNKAVQEAAAGRAHEAAHYAAVVSNSVFTEAAKQLARTNKIYLLHHSELAALYPSNTFWN